MNKLSQQQTYVSHLGLWKKGGPSPNPKGRPKGSRNKATLAAQALIESDSKRITDAAINLAAKGDNTTLKILLNALLPPAQELPIELELPEVNSPEDGAKAATEIIKSVSSGSITIKERMAMMKMVERCTELKQLASAHKTTNCHA